jgi:hypothetical protein
LPACAVLGRTVEQTSKQPTASVSSATLRMDSPVHRRSPERPANRSGAT